MHVYNCGEDGGENKTTNMLMMNAGKEITLSQALFAAFSGEQRTEMSSATELPIWSRAPQQSMMENLFCRLWKGNILLFVFLYLLGLTVA